MSKRVRVIDPKQSLRHLSETMTDNNSRRQKAKTMKRIGQLQCEIHRLENELERLYACDIPAMGTEAMNVKQRIKALKTEKENLEANL